MKLKPLLFSVVLLLCVLPWNKVFSQEIETETARLLHKGMVKAGAAFESQVSLEGREFSLPLLFEYGIDDRLELVVEPVPYAAIRPKVGQSATGRGDLEITLSYLALREENNFPAIAVAGEVKIPTANNSLIGTGKPDYALYLIASKKFGDLDVHANINYTFVGSPEGVSLSNTFFFATAAKYSLGEKYFLFSEIYGTTASASDAEGVGTPTTTITTEASGGEIVGSLGAGYKINKSFIVSFGVSYDTNNALLLRPAVSFYVPLF